MKTPGHSFETRPEYTSSSNSDYCDCYLCGVVRGCLDTKPPRTHNSKMSASGSPFHQLADSFMTSLCDDEPSFYLDPKLEPVSPEVNIDCRKTYATLEPAASKAEPQRHLSESSDSSGYLSNPEMPGHLLYPAMDRETDTDLRAWVNLHPSNWTSFEVLDWVYYVAENMGDNGCDVRGEKFNNMTGQNLLQMTRVDFEGLDDRYGSLLHESFQAIMKNSHFIRPEGFDVMMPKHESSPLPSIKNLLVPNNWHGGEGYNDRNTTPSMQELGEILNTLGNNKFSPEELMVQIGPSMYSIDESMDSSDSNAALALTTSLPACPAPDQNANIPLCVQDPSMVNEPSAPALNHTKPKGKVGRPRKVRPPGEDGPKVPGQRGRKLGQGTKGNHLWEFIRDLLFDPTHNPKIIKWEDEEDKVFRIVQSEQVAKLWGKKKNNPNMTYEKLSRALRFCRSQGHFADVPKSGRFPKKLCFRFGEKAILN